MKTKIVSLLIAFGLLNAAYAGNSAKLGLASDYFYRGVQKSEESIQGSLMLGGSLGGFNASLHVCSNQAVDSGNDSYHMGAGLGKSFAEGLFSLYGGFNHFEDVPGAALSEAEVRVSSNVLLNPSLTVYRDIDESLYTFELSVSHSLETDIADVSVNASAGNTDVTNSADRDYYSVGGVASKSLSDSSDLSIGVDYIDADNIDGEFVLGSALTFKF
jgi:hypothetical protein